MQTHLVSKIMHQNVAVILQQFNYGKYSFAALVPGQLQQFILLCQDFVISGQHHLLHVRRQ